MYSGREIIKSLVEIKAGQKILEDKIDQRSASIQEQIDIQFTTVDQHVKNIGRQLKEDLEHDTELKSP